MNTVQPIREIDKIEAMKAELLKSSYRDYLLFLCGINLGRRIGDLLNFKVSDLKNKEHLEIKEQKTGKTIPLAINETLQNAVNSFTDNMQGNEYLFQSRNGQNKPITRIQAYRILNTAAAKCGIENIGTHTMRKTFGYHFYQRTHDIATLMQLFGHSSPAITLRYIGINQDMLDKAMKEFSL
jgi:integrase